jgi:proteic killer suppression protein
MINKVVISNNAQKQLKKIPMYLAEKMALWIYGVERIGLNQMRLVRAWKDESLRGEWAGYHSIRLNKAYRAFYQVKKDGAVEFVSVEEVNKHEY